MEDEFPSEPVDLRGLARSAGSLGQALWKVRPGIQVRSIDAVGAYEQMETCCSPNPHHGCVVGQAFTARFIRKLLSRALRRTVGAVVR
eukprot:4401003-Amphidinium_carterae.1